LVRREFYSRLVTTRFTLGTNLLTDPPNRWIKKIDRLDHHLKEVRQVIVSPHMRKLVSEYRLDLDGRE
jgi:hypothetical protein